MAKNPPAAGFARYDDPGTIYSRGHGDDGDKMGVTNTLPEDVSIGATFEENLDTFCEMYLSLGRKDTTVRVNRGYIASAADAMDGKDPALWTEEDMQAYARSDRFMGYKAGTQKTMRTILKGYWEVMGRMDILPPNLPYFWKARHSYGGGSNRYDELKRKTPTPTEVQKVLDICKDVILTHDSDLMVYRHMALWFAAAYGLRRMEVANLRLCDVDLEGETLHIELSKGDKSRDVYMDIPISSEMWESFMVSRSAVIANLRDGAKNHLIAKLDSLADRDASLFFGRTNGRAGVPATPKMCSCMIVRAAKNALGRSVNTHSFRHAKAFYLLEVERIEPHQAKEYLGHSNLQQTLEYSYTGVEEQKAAFNHAPTSVPSEAPAPQPSSGTLDAAVEALTAIYEAGNLSVEAYAKAVAALNR